MSIFAPIDDTISHHVAKLCLSLDEATLAQASDYELACIANAYVHHRVQREHNSVASSGAEVLDRGTGVCGSMVLALQELLKGLGISSSLAYSLGGDVAHSMVVAHLSEGDCLLDPYHGLAFADFQSGKPLDLDATVDFARANKPAVMYIRRSAGSADLRFVTQYSLVDEDLRVDFSFPKNFHPIDNYGVANSGFVDYVQLDIPLGTTLGNPKWTAPTPDELFAYTKLANERRPDGTHLSWAYIIGQTGTGYHVQHLYRVTGLTPGKPFRVRIVVAVAYGKDGRPPLLGLTMAGNSHRARARLEHTHVQDGTSAGFQTFEATFTADSHSASLAAYATGEFVLNAITVAEA